MALISDPDNLSDGSVDNGSTEVYINTTTKTIKLNTTGMTFIGLDFMNASSVGLICGRCGYVMEFVNDGLRFFDPAPG